MEKNDDSRIGTGNMYNEPGASCMVWKFLKKEKELLKIFQKRKQHF